RKKGISVTGPLDPFEAHPKAFHLGESQRLPRDFDLAFVAMKVYDTAWAAQLALRHLKPEGYIVASENCWPDPIVASVAGASRSRSTSAPSPRGSGWHSATRCPSSTAPPPISGPPPTGERCTTRWTGCSRRPRPAAATGALRWGKT